MARNESRSRRLALVQAQLFRRASAGRASRNSIINKSVTAWHGQSTELLCEESLQRQFLSVDDEENGTFISIDQRQSGYDGHEAAGVFRCSWWRGSGASGGECAANDACRSFFAVVDQFGCCADLAHTRH